MKDLYIDSGITQSRAAVYNGKRIEEIYVENFDKINITGNIYKGRIENVVEGLNAVFVNIGFKKNAILQMDKKNVIGSFKKGQELIVQATREAVGQKGPKVTTDVSLPGKFIVLLPFEKRCHISKKIKNRESENYLKDIYSIFEEDGYGIIFRTECLEVSKEVVIKEYDYLKRVWQAISRGSEYLKAPGILFDSREFLNFVLREFVKQDIDNIHVGRKKDYEFFRSFRQGA
jgi:ribonuclease G